MWGLVALLVVASFSSSEARNASSSLPPATQVVVYEFEKMYETLEKLKEEPGPAPVELIIRAPINYTKNLPNIQRASNVVVRKSDKWIGEYVRLSAMGGPEVEMRRHFKVEGSLTLIGLHLVDGYQYGNEQEDHFGGSIRAGYNHQYAYVELIKCKFTNNHAHQNNENGVYSGGRGGAVFVRGGGLLVESVIFRGNEAFGNANGEVQAGGGQDVYMDQNSQVIVRNTNFYGGGAGESEWVRVNYEQNSEPFSCLTEIAGKRAACYGAQESSCRDYANKGRYYGVECSCRDAGYTPDYEAGTCVTGCGLHCVNGGVPNTNDEYCSHCIKCDYGWCGQKCDYRCGENCHDTNLCPINASPAPPDYVTLPWNGDSVGR